MTKIDWTASIEFDNGRPVEYVSSRPKGEFREGAHEVRMSGPPFRTVGPGDNMNQKYTYWYTDNGEFRGAEGHSEYLRIVNADDSAQHIPEDWS